MPLSDEEVICEFMEPTRTNGRWWVYGNSVKESPLDIKDPFFPRVMISLNVILPAIHNLTLDALWEVEERLAEEQWIDYVDALIDLMPNFPRKGEIIHASAAQKIKALATILR